MPPLPPCSARPAGTPSCRPPAARCYLAAAPHWRARTPASRPSSNVPPPPWGPARTLLHCGMWRFLGHDGDPAWGPGTSEGVLFFALSHSSRDEGRRLALVGEGATGPLRPQRRPFRAPFILLHPACQLFSPLLRGLPFCSPTNPCDSILRFAFGRLSSFNPSRGIPLSTQTRRLDTAPT